MSAQLNPSVLRWARVRSGLDQETLAKKIGVSPSAISAWESTGSIPFESVEKLAIKTNTAFGYLFLPSPPEEKLPVADFRRVHGTDSSKPPSPELLDAVHQCQRRQQWYREYLLLRGEPQNQLVGKASISTPIEETARDMRSTLQIGSALTQRVDTWDEALRQSIENIESAGVLVNRSGYTGHTMRKLSVLEFRGFALCDEYAPLIFVNGADIPAAQMFTLAHEVAHIWIGASAVFNLDKTYTEINPIETYCNRVAAEVLIPMQEFRSVWERSMPSGREIERLAKKFKVSRVVVARRARDAGFVESGYFNSVYNKEVKDAEKAEGGNYYLTKPYEASRRFSVALIRDARNGKTMFHDAMQLLGIKKQATFEKYANSLQVQW
jgi:Zn-dependent peptidase ImmA (M78 family)/transcriptional regulator with XRE-family HTH domain